MRETRRINQTIMLAAASAVGTAACGSGGAGDAVLSVVGDQNVRLDAGAQTELTVGYADADGVPLAGEVEFSIQGETVGDASLDASVVATNELGAATVVLDTGTTGDYEFEVRADAPGAAPAIWEIAVDPVPPLDPNGAYALHSQINTTSGLPGRAGQAVNLVIDITDDSADPTLWVVEQVIERVGVNIDPPYAIVAAVNTIVLDFAAPGIVKRLRNLGQDFGEMATNFGIESRLEISGEAGSRVAGHTLTGFAVEFDGKEHLLSFDEAGLEQAPVSGVGFSMEDDESAVFLGEHQVPVSYGTLLTFGLEQVLLQGLGSDLEGFLREGIDCKTLAKELAERLDRGALTQEAIKLGCNEVIKLGAGEIMKQLRSVDDIGMTLVLRGDAAPADDAGDRLVDRLADGYWEGEMHVADRQTALVRDDNTFTAERLGD